MSHRKSVVLGANHRLDDNVIIGYKPDRQLQNYDLVIGENAVIRSGTVIYLGSKVGRDLQTGHNVVIREDNIIGDSFRIWTNSVVDYGCRIGDGVKIHSNCYVPQYTVIEDNVFLAPGVTIANDLYPGLKESFSNMQGPIIRRGAQIGVNATILPYIEIGEGAIVGSGSVVTRNVPDGVVMVGNPAKVIKKVSEIDVRKTELLKRK